MPDPPAAHRLSNELFRHILDQIEPDSDKAIPIDRRQFLSIESFDRPLDSGRGSIRDIGRFRCACQRFADIGAPLLFTRVATRFEERGLQRLEQFASWTHLTRHVRRFTFLVPYFYRDGADHVDRLPISPGDGFSRSEVASLFQKATEQRRIRETGEDVRILTAAVARFTSLQLVQLLRVTDREDDKLLAFLRMHEDAREFIDPDWTLACSHGTCTIGTALLASKNLTWSRFSSPMLSPGSTTDVFVSRPPILSVLAERLTCLTLHFDDGENLDAKMMSLSGLLRAVFRRAKKMQAVHVGFPSHHPITLRLEDIFHGVTWDRLVAFGVQGWELDAEEILALALRHRERLKGLRLRDVYLREGRWKDVLRPLRHEMKRLEWVSLRRIGYARFFHESSNATGTEVPDHPPEEDSDSDSDDDDDLPLDGPSTGSHGIPNDPHYSDFEDDDSTEDFPESDDDLGPEADEMDFPPLHSPDTPVSAPWCNCNSREDQCATEDLVDDEDFVRNETRKFWEQWVVGRCPEHT